MAETLKDKLIQNYGYGHAITISFANISLQVFKLDHELIRALWGIDLKIVRESNNYSLMNIYDPFSNTSLDVYELNDGIYVDLDKELD